MKQNPQPEIKIDKLLVKQSGIARRLNVTESSVSMALTGYRKGPASKKLLERIKALLVENVVS